MRRLFLLLILLCFSPAYAQEENKPPLELLQTVPENHSLVSELQNIMVIFNDLINCESVGSSIFIQPAIKAELQCTPNMILITPLEEYTSQTIYIITIEPTLQAADGRLLGETVTLEYFTNIFLTASEVFPADNSEGVGSVAAIGVVFDRPIIPLTIGQDTSSFPAPFTIDPPLEGTGEWVNTFVYTFTPERMEAATVYTVTFDPELTATDGNMMAAIDNSWSFRTRNPSLLTVEPRPDSENIYLDTDITVSFNINMDTDVVEDYFSLTNLETGEEVSGTFEWIDGSYRFVFQPDEQLEAETQYQISVDGIVVNDAPIEGVTTWQFTTLPYPQLLETSPEDGAAEQRYNGITLRFNTYMDASTINDRITIEPEPEYFNGFRSGMSYYGVFEAKGSSQYTVRIEPGIQDIYGNVYDESIEFTYETLPYDPEIHLFVPSTTGFYNAYEDVSLFIRHRNVTQMELSLYNVSPEVYLDPEEDFEIIDETLLTRWTLEVPSPQDTTYPSLVSMENSCGGLLHLGDIVVLNTDVPITTYLDVLGNDPSMMLFPDIEVGIVGGPICDDDLIWWNVELDNTRGWVTEDQLKFVDVSQSVQVGFEDRLAPGIYVLTARMTDPQPEEDEYIRRHYMIAATANLTMKYSFNSLFVWATDVQTGEPIPDAPIKIYQSGSIVAAGVTNADGVLSIPIAQENDLMIVGYHAVLQTDEHFGIGTTYWSDGIDPGQFGEYAAFGYQPYSATVYTDRQIYRPGETVYFRGVIRERDDMTFTPPTELDTVHININNQEMDVEVSPFGTFDGEFQIPETAYPNYFNVIYIQLPNDGDWETLAVAQFTIGEFRLPEYRVMVDAAESNVVQGDTIQMAVAGEYYSGGNVSGANVSYQIISEPLFFRYTGRERFNFYDYEAYDSWRSREIAEGLGETDSQGVYLFELPADFGEYDQSQRYTIEATLRDEGNQTVTNRTVVNIHKGEWYIGTRPERYVSYVDDESTMNMILVDWESNPIIGQDLDVEVFKQQWYSVQERDPVTGSTAWVWELEETPITEGSVQTDEDGKAAFSFQPTAGGQYRVTFSTHDSYGNLITHNAYTWISGADYVAWRMNNNNRIPLVADQESYYVGDTAEILIASPFQGEATALITVERDGVMTYDVVHMDSNSTIYELPIEEDFAPNVFISVMIVKGVDDYSPTADFRMGVLRLPVNVEQKRITLEFESDAERYQPGDTVTYTILTMDYMGDPVEAEVGVALTDAAALAITTVPYLADDWLLNTFYKEQGIATRTSTPLTINVDRITQDILDAIKGGGGGGGGGPVSFDLREDFISTSYWNAHLLTDENGEVTFEMTLPDNLTTWQLSAFAIADTDDDVMLLGQGNHQILSTLPVLIRPVTPRFFVVGDQVTLAAVINNNSDEAVEAVVSIESNGVTLNSEIEQTVIIEADQRARVEWSGVVDNVAAAELIFYVSTADYSDASRPPLGELLPVYRYEVPETVGTAGMIREDGDRLESIVIPGDMNIIEGSVDIRLQTSLASVTLDGLDYLENYPDQCIEQTVSRFLPNIITYRALEAFDVADDTLLENLDDAVSFALEKLYNEQKSDGGWGWFLSEQSDVLTTSYALIGLTEARREGYYVDQEVTNDAAYYLLNNLIVPTIGTPAWQLNRQAIVLYALAYADVPNIAAASQLYDFREGLSIDALSFLALTFEIVEPESTIRTDELLNMLFSSAIQSATGTHWESTDRWNWGTNTRTTSLVLKTFVTLRPESELIPNIVRWLVTQRTNDAWQTTQETAWAVMALTDWMMLSGDLNPSYDYAVQINDEIIYDDVASSETIHDTTQLTIDVADLLRDEANELMFSWEGERGALYYTAHLNTLLPVSEIQALDRGVSIARIYTLPDSFEPITEARIGERVLVRLVIVAPNALHYVSFDDPLPAGVEAINPNLNTSRQLGTRPSFERIDTNRGWGWWWFSNIEFRDDRVVLSTSYLPAGVYEFNYSIIPTVEGVYNVIPATGQEFYFPEIYGRSAGEVFTVLPAE